jgi:glutamate/tyrosine decarboxylase-like PLP-dependent enzyme
VGTEVYAEINKKYIELAQFIAELDKKNAVFEAVNSERISCLSSRVSNLETLTKLVVPNSSVCPGWGNVTITPSTTPTT